MTDDAGIGVVNPQRAEQDKERVPLGRRSGVGRVAVLVESSLIADADTMGVIAFGMSPCHSLRAGEVQLSVPCDVVVVADTVEASCPVTGFQCLHREFPVAACGTTMNHNQVNVSHFQFF